MGTGGAGLKIKMLIKANISKKVINKPTEDIKPDYMIEDISGLMEFC
jgi:hypothetical protein